MSKIIKLLFLIPLCLFGGVKEYAYIKVFENAQLDTAASKIVYDELEFFLESSDPPELREAQPLEKGAIHFSEKEKVLLIFEDFNGPYLTHFFHFLEHLVPLVFLMDQTSRSYIHDIVLSYRGDMDPSWDYRGANQVIEQLIRITFPNAKVSHLLNFTDDKKLFDRVVLSSRILTEKRAGPQAVNKMDADFLGHIPVQVLESFREEIMAGLGLAPTPFEFLKITYLARDYPRALHPQVERNLIQSLQSQFGPIGAYDFSKLSFKDQIRVISSTHILISVHGNGLSHVLFLPKNALVIEIFPDDTFHWDYCFFAWMRGVKYLAMNSKGLIFTHPMSMFPPFGNAHKEVAFQNTDLVIELIKAYLSY